MPSKRKKRVLVRHRAFNGFDIVLQRKKRIWWTLGLFTYWKDWKLLNQGLYDLEEKIEKAVLSIEKDMKERERMLRGLKAERKDIESSTAQSLGLSDPFYTDVPVSELPWKKHKFGYRPDQGWIAALNPRHFQRLAIVLRDNQIGINSGSGNNNNSSVGDDGYRQSTREKVGAPDQKPGHSTAYTMPEFKGVRIEPDEIGVDTIMEFKPPQQKKNNNNNNRGKKNNQRRNNRDDYDDDYDDD